MGTLLTLLTPILTASITQNASENEIGQTWLPTSYSAMKNVLHLHILNLICREMGTFFDPFDPYFDC